MASIKASQRGLAQIKQALALKGWKMSSDRWLLEASKVLEPQKYWHEFGPYAYGCSRQTWERFLQRTPIRDSSFNAFCQVLGVDPDEVAQPVNCLKEDWGEAPDVPIFHGRKQELATLEQWILEEGCRLISIVGFAGIGKTRLVRGGIGKTDLSLQLARRVRGEFECLIWRRLLNAPPPETLLTELIEFVSDDRETQFATTPDGLVTQLLHHLKQRRCLLILDNVESILQSGERAGSYRSGYEGYGDFLRRMGESEHQSCLLLTSRVKPQLERQIPLEKSGDCEASRRHRFTLQPVLMEYMTDKAIAIGCHELESFKLQLFNSHAPIKASAKDYVKDSQIRLILQPIIEQIISVLGLEEQNSLEYQLSQMLGSALWHLPPIKT